MRRPCSLSRKNILAQFNAVLEQESNYRNGLPSHLYETPAPPATRATKMKRVGLDLMWAIFS